LGFQARAVVIRVLRTDRIGFAGGESRSQTGASPGRQPQHHKLQPLGFTENSGEPWENALPFVYHFFTDFQL
jgi:hypothetical protein